MRAQMSVPNPVRAILAACPVAGQGVHRWLFGAARRLHRIFEDPAEIADVLESASFGCGRVITPSEIESAVRNSHKYTWSSAPATENRRWGQNWPTLDHHRIHSLAHDRGDLCDLREQSPTRFDDNTSHAEAIVDALFPGDPLLCCCNKRPWEFDTRHRSQWRGQLHSLQPSFPPQCRGSRGSHRKGKIPRTHWITRGLEDSS